MPVMTRNHTRIIGIFLLIGCMAACVGTPAPYTREYAATGAVLGGIAGAVVGHQLTGRWQEGAAMGAGLGLITGAAIGDVKDSVLRRTKHVPQHRPPPGQWELFPGRWVGDRWVPEHWEWVPADPARRGKW